MADFQPVLDYIVRKEGGWQLTDRTNDRGGQTFAGISRRANPDWTGWDLIDAGDRGSPELRNLVGLCYREQYWDRLEGDHLLSFEVARSLMSCGVLSGARTAIRLAQIILGLSPDGILGPKTRGALRGVQPRSTDELLFEALFGLARIARYSEIVRRDLSQIGNFRGWVNRALEDAR